MTPSGHRSGFVGIVGRANVGKSTLLNRFVGEKVAIVSDKPQTTRNRIQAVLTRPDAQVVFIDTPGLHESRHRLGEYMQKTARTTMAEVDVLLFVVDGSRGVTERDRRAARVLEGQRAPVILVVNKIDLLEGENLRQIAEQFLQIGDFTSVALSSALQGTGTEQLVDDIVARLPEGPRYFPDDWVTDRPERFLVAEFIREQVLHFTEEEVPHSVGVLIEEMREREGTELVDVRATIVVDRESQKGILIGKGGRMLKQIGTAAREEIERMLGSRIHLQLWVKAKPGWRDRPGSLQELGYN